eukprot:TRINITY_DN5663_c0_g1_i1.p1 TRINITY_DN5663_c0_g1~~TRINITY_DN5663_c0_g1_i1.p1  ORF type:complete len:118 (-),score=12.88 TRINITY_DN5663_c0_g1_i1:55-408(-)
MQNMFVVSPPGQGIDTYRTWETFFLGRIPLVDYAPAFVQGALAGLPVIAVRDWAALSQEGLVKKHKELAQRNHFSWNLLHPVHWWVQIWNRCVLAGELQPTRTFMPNDKGKPPVVIG